VQSFLVPGFSQTAGAWAEVIAALPLRTEVTALDVPTAPTFIETVDALGDHGGRGAWVGYSMGARLVVTLALTRPELVERVILISGGLGIVDTEARQARAARDDALAARATTIGVDAFLDEWLAQPMFASLPASARRHRLTSADAIAHQLRVLGQGQMPPLRARLGDIGVPVLFLTGTDDSAYGAIARDAVTLVSNGTHVELEGGHALLHDAPQSVADAISAFIR